MPTIPTRLRIAHSAPAEAQHIDTLAHATRAMLVDLGHASTESGERRHQLLSGVAFTAAGQIGIYASRAA